MFHVYGLLAAEKAGLATKVDSLAATPEHADRRRRPHRDVRRDRLPGERPPSPQQAATPEGHRRQRQHRHRDGKTATEPGKPVTITATGGKNVTVPVTVTA